ncbi:bacteriorhodopsin [Natrialba taiwanensis]|uniref:Rhodopsin n=1 Tax=Natrialba taiwanensis DSM 12281 TaxID=1230458 RepID=L9ZQQ2_9EURY|nr:bacteriorhodopsin [Natrialba taiwanensis]ELY87468.1 rhodopsin [Natrialba taiwanensis DSM 12281]
MIGPLALLGVSSGVLVAAALVFYWRTRSLRPVSRPYGYAVVVATIAMGATYLCMAVADMSGIGTDFIRFIGYTVMWAALLPVVCAVAGADRRLTLLLVTVVVGRLWVTLGSWFLEGALAMIATLGTFGALGGGLYLLFGPISRAARTLPAERALLFTKLKYLLVLGWCGLVVTGLLSGSLTLADDFVGQLIVIYVEAILLLGFGGMVLRSSAALEQTASSTGLLSFDTELGDADTPESTEHVDHAD